MFLCLVLPVGVLSFWVVALQLGLKAKALVLFQRMKHKVRLTVPTFNALISVLCKRYLQPLPPARPACIIRPPSGTEMCSRFRV